MKRLASIVLALTLAGCASPLPLATVRSLPSPQLGATDSLVPPR